WDHLQRVAAYQEVGYPACLAFDASAPLILCCLSMFLFCAQQKLENTNIAIINRQNFFIVVTSYLLIFVLQKEKRTGPFHNTIYKFILWGLSALAYRMLTEFGTPSLQTRLYLGQ